MALSKRERAFHRKIAAACFNGAWDYLEMKRRTPAEEVAMLNLAHSSLYHWQVIGTERNIAISEWQLSRAYVEVGDQRLAMRLATSCLERCTRNGITDILHTANEALARAYAAAGDRRKALRCISQAKSQLSRLKLRSEERKVYDDQITETESLIRSLPKKQTSSW